MIIINFKNYKLGKDALELAKSIEKYLPNTIAAVSSTAIGYLAYYTKLKIYAQHVDCVEDSKTTGFLHPKAIKSYGAIGTLLNHSEHKINFNNIKKTLALCKKYGLKAVVCASSLQEAIKIKKLNPYAIAFEDPKLVGSGKSITQYRSSDVKKFAELFKNSKIIPLCGAGISSAEDVQEAYNLGCKGVLIASAIANSENPDKLLKEISNSKI